MKAFRWLSPKLAGLALIGFALGGCSSLEHFDSSVSQDSTLPGGGVSGGTGIPVSGTPVVESQLSTGDNLNCATTALGTVQCWGDDTYGSLGNGIVGVSSKVPLTIAGLSGVASVATSRWHSCSLSTSGTVECWGYFNIDGGTINEADGFTSDPLAVTGLTAAATQLALTASSSCALITGGTVECWGNNSHGELGDGTTTDSATPVGVSGLAGVTQLAGGQTHVCALLSDSTVRCWGDNSSGQLGNGTTTTSEVPVVVTGLSGVTEIAAGGGFSCARVAGGAVECWGINADGELANGSNLISSVPSVVLGLVGATKLYAGAGHACVLFAGGTAACWGLGTSGQLGNAGLADSYAPVSVATLTGAVSLSLGTVHSCAMMGDGTLRCWGSNQGQIFGKNAGATSSIPVEVAN